MSVSAPFPPDGPAQLARVQQHFVQHLVALRGMLRAFVHDRALVDDLVQEVFLTVTAKAEAYREGTSFRAWIFAIARYKVLEALRVRGRSEALSDEVIEALCAVGPEDDALDDRLGHLEACIDRLAPQARRAIELRYQQGHRLPEVAQIMGWSPGALKVALCRAREVLRECIQRRLAAEQA